MSQPVYQQFDSSGRSHSWTPYPHAAQASHPYPGQPYQNQPSSHGQPHPGHGYPGQPFPGQPQPPQPYPGQPYSGQPRPGRPAAEPALPFPARPEWRYSGPPAPPPAPPRKRRLALKLFLLSVVALIVGAGYLVTRPPVSEPVPDTPAVPEPSTLSVFDLQPGDCYNTMQAPPQPGQSQPISYVETVPCTQPHTDQVIAKISYSPSEATGGVPTSRADADCNTEFAAKLEPAAFDDPTLKPGRLAPADAATWARTPVVACVVFSDNPITRTLLR